MSGKFTHYLVTRYNVQIPNFEFDKKGKATSTDEWLEDRFHLFSKFCLPSVLQQSNKNFTWLIYVDQATKLLYLNQLREAIGNHQNILLRPVKHYTDCVKDIDEILSKAETPFVITTRLDNDDALATDFIDIIQNQFIEHDKTLINLLQGYGYNINTRVLTRLINMKKNHFTSLIEKKKTSGHITIRGFPHDEPPPDLKIINVKAKPTWMKFFHDRNVKSNAFGYPVFLPVMYSRFGLNKNDIPISFLNTIKYSAWWLPDGIARKFFIRKKQA